MKRTTPFGYLNDWTELVTGGSDWQETAHDDMEITFVDRGVVTYKEGSRDHKVGPGEAILVPQDTEHRTGIFPGTRARAVHMTRDLFESVEAFVAPTKKIATGMLVISPNENLLSLGRILFAEAARCEMGARLMMDAIAEATVVEVLRSTTSPDLAVRAQSDPRIGRAVEMIESSYADHLSVDDLAGTAGMSRFHFSRSFRASTGMSPYQYLTEVRLRRAAALLRRSDCSVTEAALTVGFTDLSRFSALFRKRFGLAPSEYSTNRSQKSKNRRALRSFSV